MIINQIHQNQAHRFCRSRGALRAALASVACCAPAAHPECMPTCSSNPCLDAICTSCCASRAMSVEYDALVFKKLLSPRPAAAARRFALSCKRHELQGLVSKSKGSAAFGHATIYQGPTCWYLKRSILIRAKATAYQSERARE